MTTVPVLLIALFLSAPHFAHAYAQTYYQGSYYGQGTYYSQSTYYSQGTYYSESSYDTTFTTDVDTNFTVDVTGHVSKGSGSFVIDHPLDPKNKLLYHSFVESPDVKNIYDGVAMLDEQGEATIELPDYFEALNVDYRFLLTPIGQSMPNLHVAQTVKNNRFSVSGGESLGKISWQVTGIRNDPFIRAYPVYTEVQKIDAAIADPAPTHYAPSDNFFHRWWASIMLIFTNIMGALS